MCGSHSPRTDIITFSAASDCPSVGWSTYSVDSSSVACWMAVAAVGSFVAVLMMRNAEGEAVGVGDGGVEGHGARKCGDGEPRGLR